MSPHREPGSKRASRYRLAILAGGILVLTALHHVTIHGSAQERISQLRERIRTADLETQKQEQSKARVPDLKQQLDRLTKELTERNGLLADVRDRPVLLKEIAQRARTTGLRILRVRPGKERQRTGYAEIPLELSLHGSFRNLVRFLHALAPIPQLSRIGALTILAQQTTDHRVTLEIHLEILTYRIPPPYAEARTFGLTGELAHTPGPVTPSQTGQTGTRLESLMRLRDPFDPTQGIPCRKPASGLQSYDLNELRLVGVIWELHEPRGLVMDGAESGHIIIPGSPIGNRGGTVKAITPTQVLIEENPPNGVRAARSMSLQLPYLTARDPTALAAQETLGTGNRDRGAMAKREQPLRSHCTPKP